MKKIPVLYLEWLRRYLICNETAIYYGGPDSTVCVIKREHIRKHLNG